MSTDSPPASPAKFRCELHMHSTYSDGSASPETLLNHAAKIGLQVVAITDHDNARGARVAGPVAEQLKLELIPAIEFTTSWEACQPGGGQDVDVLGYFVDLDNAALLAAEDAALQDLYARLADCCARLEEAGYPITMNDVFTQEPRSAGLRQIGQALVRKGHVSNYPMARMLAFEHWQKVRLSRFTLAQQIAVIHAAGGVAMLAHPAHVDCGQGWIQAEHVEQLVSMEIDGIEVYHRSTSNAARKHFQTLADQFGLLVSGGSDEHGWSPDLPYMGTEPVTRAMIDAMRARHRERAAALGAKPARRETPVVVQPASSAAPPPHKPIPRPRKWLVIGASAVLETVATENYVCYTRAAPPPRPTVITPVLPGKEPPTLQLVLVLRDTAGAPRFATEEVELKNQRRDRQQAIWNGFIADRCLQVIWVWDFYRIQSHIALRVGLPPEGEPAESETAWRETLAALRAVQPGDRLDIDVVSACGDIHQQHTVAAAPTEWTPPEGQRP